MVPSALAPRHRLALAHRPVLHAAQREAADVRRRVEVGDQRLERMALVVLGRRDVVEQDLEQRLEASAPPATPFTGRGRPRRTRRDRHARCSRRSGSRSGARRRRGRGTAPTPRGRPRRCGRRGGRPCSPRGSRAGAPRAPCAARTGSAGSGPSLASTSSSTPSTIVSPRSTSPPKSAWPGVSMMLIFTSPYRTAVFLARIVMPFSRSRSFESMTRSTTSWLAPNAPVCQSMASTRVVLPWSTWATMATLRRARGRTWGTPEQWRSGGTVDSTGRSAGGWFRRPRAPPPDGPGDHGGEPGEDHGHQQPRQHHDQQRARRSGPRPGDRSCCTRPPRAPGRAPRPRRRRRCRARPGGRSTTPPPRRAPDRRHRRTPTAWAAPPSGSRAR